MEAYVSPWNGYIYSLAKAAASILITGNFNKAVYIFLNEKFLLWLPPLKHKTVTLEQVDVLGCFTVLICSGGRVQATHAFVNIGESTQVVSRICCYLPSLSVGNRFFHHDGKLLIRNNIMCEEEEDVTLFGRFDLKQGTRDTSKAWTWKEYIRRKFLKKSHLGNVYQTHCRLISVIAKKALSF